MYYFDTTKGIFHCIFDTKLMLFCGNGCILMRCRAVRHRASAFVARQVQLAALRNYFEALNLIFFYT